MPKLSGMELQLIEDAMYNYDPGKLDYSDLRVIGLLRPERVIAALHKLYLEYGTTSALRLADKLSSLKTR